MSAKNAKENYEITVKGFGVHNVQPEDLSAIDLIKTETGTYHVIHQGKSLEVTVLTSDFPNKRYRVLVGKREYELRIADPLDQQIAAMGFDSAKNAQVNQITAPMPGLILDINIASGQEVKETDPLLILEAMKMENVLTAPRDGIVKAVCCAKGDAVEKTQLLVEFE